MPQDLDSIRSTEDGVTVETAKVRAAILEFLSRYPGQYFGVHDFEGDKFPDGTPIPRRIKAVGPFWWLSDWGKGQAPEGYEGLYHGDPRVEYEGYVSVVGKIGTTGFTRIAATREEILSRQANKIAEDNRLLDEVRAFLEAHRGTAFTSNEIADALVPKPSRHFPFQKRVEPVSRAGFTRLDITSTLYQIRSWHRGDASIWKDIVTTYAERDVYYGLPKGGA